MSSDKSVTLSDADMRFMAAIFKNGGSIELTNVNWEAVLADTNLKNIATAKSTWQRVKKKINTQTNTDAQTFDKTSSPQKRKADQIDVPKKVGRNKRKVKVEPELPNSEPDSFAPKASDVTDTIDDAVVDDGDIEDGSFFDNAFNKDGAIE